MRNLFFGVALALLLFAAAPALAQETPKAEVFGGYQYQTLNVGAQIALSTNPSAPTAGGNAGEGFGAGVPYNLSDHFGAAGDIGGCWETGLVTGLPAHDVNFLLGPRVRSHSNGKVTPFAQCLFDGQHAKVNSATNLLDSKTASP